MVEVDGATPPSIALAVAARSGRSYQFRALVLSAMAGPGPLRHALDQRVEGRPARPCPTRSGRCLSICAASGMPVCAPSMIGRQNTPCSRYYSLCPMLMVVIAGVLGIVVNTLLEASNPSIGESRLSILSDHSGWRPTAPLLATRPLALLQHQCHDRPEPANPRRGESPDHASIPSAQRAEQPCHDQTRKLLLLAAGFWDHLLHHDVRVVQLLV